MREEFKKYRLSSTEEPTDEMLQELMEEVAESARASSAKAEANLRRMMDNTVRIIEERRSQRQNVQTL